MTLESLVRRVSRHDGARYIPIVEGLSLARSSEPYGFEALIYEPLLCLILQGQKETVIGGRTHALRAGECIVVSHALPVTSRVTHASPEAPYLALVAPIDLSLLRALDHEIGEDADDAPGGASLVVHPVDGPTLDVLGRFAALADDPADARMLGPGVRRELHYRLLKAPGGGMLRALGQRGSHASNIARAIERLRTLYRERLEVDELARSVGMSPSSFYRHFKQITSTSPLQYQKDLRLAEARRLLRGGEHTVSTAAFAVGYESPSQFSREYARSFGAPPREDLLTQLEPARSGGRSATTGPALPPPLVASAYA